MVFNSYLVVSPFVLKKNDHSFKIKMHEINLVNYIMKLSRIRPNILTLD